jgi:uncharacterized protein YecE (DUF72 family)
MDFGKAENLRKVDFTLPPDDKITVDLLKALKKKKKKKPEIYIGCAKWGRTDWVGKLYPKGTKERDFLEHYVQHFNCIELNAMFYRLFPVTTVEKWAETAPKGFRFCPKYSRVITQLKRLNNVDRQTHQFIETVSAFGDKLGTSFMTLDERYSTKFYERLHDYLRKLPRDFNTALELRNIEWTEESTIVVETYELMRELGITSVITDTAGRRDMLHMKLTTPECFIRYVGNSLHKSDFRRIDDWVERLGEWLDSGLQRIYFFIHQHDELYSPELSKYMIDKLNDRCGLKLHAPKLLNKFKVPKH